MQDVYLYDAIRSARTKAKDSGGLHSLTPPELLAQLYRHLEQRIQLQPHRVSEVILGCVTQQGEQAANIAKTSALHAGWPASVAGLTVNRFCSSSIDAIALAAMKVATGHSRCIVAGGIEMMSRVPLLADKARVFADPGYAVANQMLLMGSGADLIATRGNMSREAVDAVALRSQQRAAEARAKGYFTSIVPITTDAGVVDTDECIRADMTAQRLAALPPAFAKLGEAYADKVQLAAYGELEQIRHVHTAGNSPAMCDAASVVVLGDAALGEQLGIAPRAKLVASATACGEPLEVLAGCIDASRAVLARAHVTTDDIQLFEIHEAFAATSIKVEREMGLEDKPVNVNGGVIALGHPMGATGAIMTGTLLDEMNRRDLELGLVAASGAAGSGSALILQRC